MKKQIIDRTQIVLQEQSDKSFQHPLEAYWTFDAAGTHGVCHWRVKTAARADAGRSVRA